MLVYNMPFVAMVNNFISAIFMKASLNYSNYCGVWKKMKRWILRCVERRET